MRTHCECCEIELTEARKHLGMHCHRLCPTCEIALNEHKAGSPKLILTLCQTCTAEETCARRRIEHQAKKEQEKNERKDKEESSLEKLLGKE
jgi:hypothetical protein